MSWEVAVLSITSSKLRLRLKYLNSYNNDRHEVLYWHSWPENYSLSTSRTVKLTFSETCEWIAIKIGTDIHDVQWLTPNDFDPVIQASATRSMFSLILVKYTNIHRLDWKIDFFFTNIQWSQIMYSVVVGNPLTLEPPWDHQLGLQKYLNNIWWDIFVNPVVFVFS